MAMSTSKFNIIATYNIRSTEKDSEKNIVLCKKGDHITPFDGTAHCPVPRQAQLPNGDLELGICVQKARCEGLNLKVKEIYSFSSFTTIGKRFRCSTFFA